MFAITHARGRWRPSIRGTAKSSLLPTVAHRLVLEIFFLCVCVYRGEYLGEFSGYASRAEPLCHGAYVLQSIK